MSMFASVSTSKSSPHFKSKLLTFPGVRFSPHDEAERGRFAAYALYGRSAEATTVRAAATALLTSHPQRAVVVLGDLNDVGGVRPPLRSSTGRPARRLVLPALTAPTTVTRNGCGTSPRASLPRNDLAESTEDASS